MKIALDFGGCCAPAIQESSKSETKDEEQKPQMRAIHSSPVVKRKNARYSIRSVPKYAPVKFLTPKRRSRFMSSPGEGSARRSRIVKGTEVTEEKIKHDEGSGRKIMTISEAKMTDSTDSLGCQLKLDNLGSYNELEFEEKNAGTTRSHRYARTADLSSMIETLKPRQKGRRSFRRLSTHSGSKRRSRITRAHSQLVRQRTSENTPRSGAIQKSFRIGEKKFSAKDFVEKKIYY